MPFKTVLDAISSKFDGRISLTRKEILSMSGAELRRIEEAADPIYQQLRWEQEERNRRLEYPLYPDDFYKVRKMAEEILQQRGMLNTAMTATLIREAESRARDLMAGKISDIDKVVYGTSQLMRLKEDQKIIAEIELARDREQCLYHDGWYGEDVVYNLSIEGEQIMSKNFWETGGQFAGLPEEATDKLQKVYVLVDGDIVAYRCSAAADGRYYEVSGERFKYSKDAKAYADKRSLPAKDIVSGYDPEPVENALNSVAVTIENIQNYFIFERKVKPIIKICLSCKRNFRYDAYPDYKKSRVNVRRPEHLAACKQYLIDQFKGMMFDPFEADDLIAMMVTQLAPKAAEQRIFIASNDKDFTQLGREGVEFYDFTTGKTWEVTEQEARMYFYKQLLTGDKSDDIPGVTGIGPETAIKILTEPSELHDESEDMQLYMKVLKAYMAIFPELPIPERVTVARKRIITAATLLHLVRDEATVGDFWKPPEPKNPNKLVHRDNTTK